MAYFGTFGYELDLNALTADEQEEVKEQIAFMKQYRRLFQFGTFYRLQSPFENNTSCLDGRKRRQDRGNRRLVSRPERINLPYTRLHLKGLAEDVLYTINGEPAIHYGSELMHAGLITTDASSGQAEGDEKMCQDLSPGFIY